MLVNKTVEFFLSEAAGRGGRSAVSGGGLERDAGDQITWQTAGSERPGTGRDAGDQITWAGSGLGAARDRTRYRRRPRLGPGQDAVGGRG